MLEDGLRVAAQIGKVLREKGATIAVSEAACGGLIAAYLVSVPGASQFFVGGTTAYALRSRLHLSGWSTEDISNYTGPSAEVAERLARQLRIELGATYALAENGWAGPEARPASALGTVYLSVAGPKGKVTEIKSTGAKDRVRNMEEFALLALTLLLRTLQADSL